MKQLWDGLCYVGRVLLMVAIFLMIGCLVLIFLDLAANKAKADEHTVQVLLIYDGDTFTANINLDFGLVLQNQQIRVYNFDAWEISRVRKTVTITADELFKGKDAQRYLSILLGQAHRVTIEPAPTKDPYGRILAIVRIDGKLLSDLMRAKGHERKEP